MLLVLDLRGRVVDRLGLGMTYISRDVDCNSFSKVWRLLWPFHASCCRLKDRFSMNILMTCVCPPAGLFLHWIRTKMQQRSGYTQEVWILCSTNLNYSNVKSTCCLWAHDFVANFSIVLSSRDLTLWKHCHIQIRALAANKTRQASCHFSFIHPSSSSQDPFGAAPELEGLQSGRKVSSVTRPTPNHNQSGLLEDTWNKC